MTYLVFILTHWFKKKNIPCLLLSYESSICIFGFLDKLRKQKIHFQKFISFKESQKIKLRIIYK